MELAIGDRALRPLTADEVMRMVETGILAEDEHVELLHGVLTEMSPKGEPHEETIVRVLEWLAPLVVAGGHRVRIAAPVVVPDRTSLPEPDIAVVQRDDTTIAHPRTALLVVEVAVTSLRTDTAIKPALYAAAGVPETWVVDVVGRRLHVFTDPRPDGYAHRETLVPPAVAKPRALDLQPLDLEGLLAGLEAGATSG